MRLHRARPYVLEVDMSAVSPSRCVALFLQPRRSPPIPAGFLGFDPSSHTIEVIHVGEEVRRRGFARDLLRVARSLDPELRYSDTYTVEGEAWARASGLHVPALRERPEPWSLQTGVAQVYLYLTHVTDDEVLSITRLRRRWW